MAFVRLLWVASRVDSVKKDFIVEKQNAVKASHGEKVNVGLKLKWRHFWVDTSYGLKKSCANICSCFRNTKLHRCCYRLGHDGTCENFTFKSVVGFMGGFLLTYIFFMFFVFQLNFKLSTATIMCALLGSILTIGLAFSTTVRCIVFLLLPQFFSKRGRQALLAYAFILAITGPAKNTLNNMSILSESLACGQEQLKAAVKQIIEVIKKPFYAIKDALKAVVKTVKVIVKKIKEILLTIKRIVMAIVKVIKAAFQFLAKIINICNKELGTPFERCSRVFESAISDCNAKLGPLFNWLCSIVYLVKSVCYIVKIFDFVCMIVDFISNSVIGVVIKKIKTFVRHIRTMFYVRIRFSHSFHFQTNQSKSMSDVAEGIITEIRHRSDSVLTVFDLMSCATTVFFLFIILKTMQYRYRFLTSERFDNIYITRNFRNVDLRRAKLGKETVLPLNNRERSLYVPTGSLRLVKPEKKGLSKSAIVLTTATVKLCTHMLIDYALYWVLTVIRYHARFQSKVKAPNMPGVHIQGNGLLADLLKSIVKAFQPMGLELEIDTIPCLPDAIPPDYDRYIQIVSLLILCWILTILEPYGLRLRHTVMCYYHPTRAKQRAVWLYNYILRSRSSFLKFARRQLRRKVTGSKDITKITCKEYLRSNIRSPLLRVVMCLGSDKQDTCLLCGEVFREGEKSKPIRCQTPGCPGVYCEECFTDLQNLCTVCLDPIEYGDLSDISEERDSSEPEFSSKIAITKKVKKKRKRFCQCSRCCASSSESESDTDLKQGQMQYEQETPLSDFEEVMGEDSDYSSDEKSDYSYTYQEEKDLTVLPENTPRSSFTDVEAQQIPDYVSMESFHDIAIYQDGKRISIVSENTSKSSITSIEEEYTFKKRSQDINTFQDKDESLVVPKNTPKFSVVDKEGESTDDYAPRRHHLNTNITDYNLQISSDESDDLLSKPKHSETKKKGLKKNTFADKHMRLGELLKLRIFSKRSANSIEEEEDPLLNDKSNLEATFSTPHGHVRSRSISSDSNSSSTVTQKISLVPPLHLSSLDSDSMSSGTRNTSWNVRYEIVRESSSTATNNYENNLKTDRSDSTLSSSSVHKSSGSLLRSKDEEYLDFQGYDKYNTYKRKIRTYYKSTNNIKSTDNPSVVKMQGGLMKFLTRFFHKTPKNRSSAYNGKSSPDDIDKVSLLSPKSSFSSTSELSNSSNSSSLNQRSCEYTSTTTSHSTLMGSTPRKHLRAGEETGKIKDEIQGSSTSKNVVPDLDSSDSDITLVEAQGIKIKVQASKQHQMKTDDHSKSPPIKIYSREPPEKDESHTAMRNLSSQVVQRYHDETHSKSDSSVLSKNQRSRPDEYYNTHVVDTSMSPPRREYENIPNIPSNKKQRNKPEDYFNTSLIEAPTSSARASREYERILHSKDDGYPASLINGSGTFREATALQKYEPKHIRYSIDDEGTCSESTCPHHRRSMSPPSLETPHHITHYRSICRNKKYNSGCSCPKCKCYHCCDCQACPYTTDEEQTTSYSNTSLTTDFMDLPYQNNNEYLGLVHELEDTLSARNKERVRKTMREFEYLSKHNKSLEKPIFDDDDDAESNTAAFHQYRQKHPHARRRPRSASAGRNTKCCCQKKDCICRFSRRALNDCERRLASVPPEVGCQGSVLKEMDPKPTVGDATPKTIRCRTRWSMNPRTGEWYKVYDELEERYCKSGPSRHHKSRSPEYHRDSSGYSRHNRPDRCYSSGCYCCRHGAKY